MILRAALCDFEAGTGFDCRGVGIHGKLPEGLFVLA
jgi:hypothetical protein